MPAQIEKNTAPTITRYIQGYATLGIYYRLLYVHWELPTLVTTPTFAFHLGRYGESVILKRNICTNHSDGNLVNTTMFKINLKPNNVTNTTLVEFSTQGNQLMRSMQCSKLLSCSDCYASPSQQKLYNLIFKSRQKCKKIHVSIHFVLMKVVCIRHLHYDWVINII